MKSARPAQRPRNRSMIFPSPRVRLPSKSLRPCLRFPSVAVVDLCAALLCLAAAPATGCTGTIGDVENMHGVDVVGNPSTGPTGGGIGGGVMGAAGGPATTGGGTGRMAGAACAVAPVPVQRLTKLEYNNAVRDLFGVQKDYTAGFSDDAEGPAGFTTEGIAQNLALSQVTDYLNAAKAVVADVFAASPNRLLTCTSGDACAQPIITSLATKAFRGPPRAEEITNS